MTLYYVYIRKHVSQVEMRYGTYVSFYDAAEAVKQAKLINTVDEFYIDEKRINADALSLSERQAMLVDLCLAK